MTHSDTLATTPPTRLSQVRAIILSVVIVGTLGIARLLPTGQWLDEFRDWVTRHGTWGAAVFCAVYVTCTVLFVPGSILTVGAGVLYGPVWGTAIASVSSTIGAALAFFVGRYLAREQVRAWIAGSPKFDAVDQAIARRGGWIVLLLRLSPVFPFNLLNYVLGLTGVRFRHYLLASWLGMLPGSFAYVLVGHAGQETLAGGQKVAYWIIAAVATLAVTTLVTRIANRAIDDVTPLQTEGRQP